MYNINLISIIYYYLYIFVINKKSNKYIIFYYKIYLYNNVTFGAESFRSRSHVTTTNHNFTSFGLTSIMVLDSSSSILLTRRRLVPPHLYHKVESMFTYKSKGYSVGCVSGMIRDNKGKQENDDEDLGGW